MKVSMKEINRRGFYELQAADAKAYADLISCQIQRQNCTSDEIKRNATDNYKRIHGLYISFLQQKAKVSWIKEGDENFDCLP